LQEGVGWPSPRFTDNGNGTVTDNLTGLMWTKDAFPAGSTKTWQGALDYVKTVTTGGYTDWRLPNRKEIRSLVDYSHYNPALPQGHPFTNVQSIRRYWSSTSFPSTAAKGVWLGNMINGACGENDKTDVDNVWPVRCGRLAITTTTTTIIPTTTSTVQPTTTTTSVQPTTTTTIIPTTTTTAPATTTTTELPTLISLITFEANGLLRRIILTWDTASEFDNAGFNLYRAETENGAYIKINAALIPAKGSVAQGAAYRYIDWTAEKGKTYFYKLEDVDIAGIATQHGPASATAKTLYMMMFGK